MSSSTNKLRWRTPASCGRSGSSDSAKSLATASSEPGLIFAMIRPRLTATVASSVNRPGVVVHARQPLLEGHDPRDVGVAKALLLGRGEHRVRALGARERHADAMALLEHEH